MAIDGWFYHASGMKRQGDETWNLKFIITAQKPPNSIHNAAWVAGARRDQNRANDEGINIVRLPGAAYTTMSFRGGRNGRARNPRTPAKHGRVLPVPIWEMPVFLDSGLPR